MKEKNEIQTKQKYGITDVKNIGDSVNNKVVELVEKGRLTLPNNYSLGNAMSSAYLILQDTKDKNGKPALEVCTKESVANALLNMAILGLNPAKKHCYFIPYGDKLTLFVSYFGKQAVIKRFPNILSELTATLIYKGDEISIAFNELHEPMVTSHKTAWENMNNGEIEGCYATVKQKQKDGSVIERSVVMTKREIKEAFDAQKIINPKYGYAREHKDFEGEFTKRTTINRLVKGILQTSNDDDLVADTLQETEYDQYDFESTPEEKIEKRIETNANTGEVIGIKEPEEKEVKEQLKAKAKFEDFEDSNVPANDDDYDGPLQSNGSLDLDENDPY